MLWVPNRWQKLRRGWQGFVIFTFTQNIRCQLGCVKQRPRRNPPQKRHTKKYTSITVCCEIINGHVRYPSLFFKANQTHHSEHWAARRLHKPRARASSLRQIFLCVAAFFASISHKKINGITAPFPTPDDFCGAPAK
jgi:hypothetical protein